MKTLSEGGNEILRDAVNCAREFQCPSLKSLRDLLHMRWPGREADIEDAIKFWRSSVRESHPDRVSRV